ncbi:NF-kappa-B inhibitor zeta [Archocentrus centrarchus]|uniref:NF-kappa-B inhibitor zeta n=1 Tax=Archocentrus centrarchus TaxID=63155 RepID=UPI0011EA1B57|nr:NF-kappa-B inhibitor zeta-like [Archocentrus centrarchus]
MRGRNKRNVRREKSEEAGFSPLSGETAAGLAEPDAPVPGATDCDVRGTKKGGRCSIYGNKKVYLGVRVRMPVKDLLRNFRLSQGWGPQDLKKQYGKTAKGDLKRAKSRSRCQTVKVQQPSKSLEELSIIVEVLEEDLRTGNSHPFSPPPLSPTDSPVSPQLSPDEINSDKYNEIIPSPPSYMTHSPGAADYHQAPPGFMFPSCAPLRFGILRKDCERREEWFDPENHSYNVNSSTFFWTQLQKEEGQLRDVSDAELLAADEHGRTVLHKVACVGKRALGCAIAKRMAAVNSLDLKDSDGMTPLLYASKYNHHLMVADLIYLGANVNETNNAGKSCLHLSAENGYTRVLEVLKHAMMDGVYVDVEATDNSGMSVLQCASIALKATMCEVESNKSLSHSKLHTLRQEQMMETLECVLQMGSFLHTMGWQQMQPRLG